MNGFQIGIKRLKVQIKKSRLTTAAAAAAAAMMMMGANESDLGGVSDGNSAVDSATSASSSLNLAGASANANVGSYANVAASSSSSSGGLTTEWSILKGKTN